MKKLSLTLMFTLALSACTFQPTEDGMQGSFHPPLTYGRWSIDPHYMVGSKQVCAISSGYHGITVFPMDGKAGNIAVKSNRDMTPGDVMVITIGNQRFETAEEFMRDPDAAKLAPLLGKHKTYVEWSEKSFFQGRNRWTNILLPEGFDALYKDCLKRTRR